MRGERRFPRARQTVLFSMICLVAASCDPNAALDRVTVAFTPQTEELEVALWLKQGLKAPVGAELQSILPWGMLRLEPATAPKESARLILRMRPTVFDDPAVLRLPPERFTRSLPNGVSHGIGVELATLVDPTAPSDRPQLFAYADAYSDSAQWVGAAVTWPAGQVTPIPRGAAVWFPLKRDSQERVILSVAFYGAQTGLGPERDTALAAVFADYRELGRQLGGGVVRRVETIRLGK